MSANYSSEQPTIKPPHEFDTSPGENDSIVDSLSANDICTMFDRYIMEFERMEKSGVITVPEFLDVVEDVTNVVLSISPHKLLDPKVLSHSLMHFLHQMLIDLLVNWRESFINLNIQEIDIYFKIIFIFVHIAEQAPASGTPHDQDRKKRVLAMKHFWLQVNEHIELSKMSSIVSIDEFSMCTLGLFAITLLIGYPFYYKMGPYESLNHYLIMDWLDLYDFIEAVNRLEHGGTLSDLEYNVLFICWEHLSSTSSIKHDNSTQTDSMNLLYSLCDELLSQLEEALNQTPLVHPNTLAHILERCEQLLIIQNLPSFDKHAPNVLDSLTKISENLSPTNPDDEASIIVILNAFYILSKNPHILPIMKNRNLEDLFSKYTTSENVDIQKLATVVLAEILNDQRAYQFDENMTLVSSGSEPLQQKDRDTESKTKTEIDTNDETSDNTKEDKLNSEKVQCSKTNVGNISNWNRRKVREFLLQHQLITMMPLLDGIDGEELFNLYNMCKTHSAAMYRSLKFELRKLHHMILPVSDYLHFTRLLAAECNDDFFLNLNMLGREFD